MSSIKQQLKHFAMGFEHMAVALTSILFVSAILGISPKNAFLAVGISTLIFHGFTRNKLSSVLGISASYIGGMVLIQQSLGWGATAFGVFGIGAIYLVLGILLRKFPNLLSSIPQFIYKLSVVYIALLLIPIGWSMANSPLGIVTLGVLLILFLIPKVKDYTLPLALVIMGSGTLALGMWTDPLVLNELMIIGPTPSIQAFLAISLISLSVMGEVLGDVSATAMINDVELGKDVMWSDVFLGMGIANMGSSVFGLPTVSYSENNGFLRSIGSRDLHPTAQLYTAVIFIFMAFVPGLAGFLSMIPFPIYGALLLFLFANLGISTLKEIEFDRDKLISTGLAFVAFAATYGSTVISPITAAFATSLFAYFLLKKGGDIFNNEA